MNICLITGDLHQEGMPAAGIQLTSTYSKPGHRYPSDTAIVISMFRCLRFARVVHVQHIKMNITVKHFISNGRVLIHIVPVYVFASSILV